MTQSPKDVRAQLIDALRLDLVGPRTGHVSDAPYAEERLPIAPSKWYLTGFLIPYEAPSTQRSDDDVDDQVDVLDKKVHQADDDTAPEEASARKAFFPSSMGLSVLVPQGTAQLRVRVAWGDYLPLGRDGTPLEPGAEEELELDDEAIPSEREGRGRWQRIPREAEQLVTLERGVQTVALSEHKDLKIVVSVRQVADAGPSPDHLAASPRNNGNRSRRSLLLLLRNTSKGAPRCESDVPSEQARVQTDPSVPTTERRRTRSAVRSSVCSAPKWSTSCEPMLGTTRGSGSSQRIV